MRRKPVPWIAAVLGVIAAPLAMLYARRPLVALGFTLAGVVIGICGFIGVIDEMSQGILGWALLIAGGVVAYRCARSSTDAAAPWYARWYSLLGIALAFTLVFLLIRIFLYEPFRIPSTAMLPTLPRKANVIVQKHGYGHPGTLGLNFGRLPVSEALKRGDIIVFDFPRDPSQSFVKRIIGLPGDRVAFVGKNVVVNGQETRVQQLDDYLDVDALAYRQRHLNRLDAGNFETLINADAPAARPDAWNFPMKESCSHSEGRVECTVPPERYFVMGDNRDNSFDSRYWGYVRSDQIIGKLIKVFPPAVAN